MDLWVAVVGAVSGAVATGLIAMVGWFYRDRLNLWRGRMDDTMSRQDELLNEMRDIDEAVDSMSSRVQTMCKVLEQNANRHERAQQERARLEKKFDAQIDKLRDESVRTRELDALRGHLAEQFDLMRSWMKQHLSVNS